MNFSKLLCLVLVYSEQFGQVLADTTPECTGNDGGADVPCNGKKGGSVKLKVNSQTAVSQWTKGGADLTTADDTKYTVGSTAPSSLTILKLETLDDGVYKTKDLPSTQQSFKVKVVDCIGDTGTPAICKGKKGGSIKLGLKDATAAANWKKGNDPVGPSPKYEGPVNEATLTIKDLDDVTDDAEYTGGTNNEKFSVQVADCFGTGTTDGSTVPCSGELGKPLKLRISDIVSGSPNVVWVKEEGSWPSVSQKVGPKDEGLKLSSLGTADKGSYKATYDSKSVTFVVSIPENDPDPNPNPNPNPAAETVNNGKKNNDDSKGSSKTNSTTTEKPAPKDKGSGAGGGGGGGVLSYSPALLVTVTLVHLLLQLAA